MHKNKYMFGKKHRLWGFLLWLLIFFIVFSSFPLQAKAEEESGESSSPYSSFETVSHSDIVHAHRGSSSASGECYQTPVCHVHSGNVSSGGACYTGVTHKHSSDCYKTATCTITPISWEVCDYKITDCPNHGSQTATYYTVLASHSSCGAGNTTLTQGGNCNVCGGNVAATTHEYKKQTCKKSTSTIESYKLSCGKTEGVTIESYALSCPLEERKYGSLELVNSTPNWTCEQVVLTASLEDPEGVIAADGFGTVCFLNSSGNVIESSSNSITVSENGAYKCLVTVNPSVFDSASAEVMITVSNIDRTPPEIGSITYNTEDEWVLSNTICVTATDLQPDGSPGSGLALEAYSFDGGKSWQANPEFRTDKNGTYEIVVRDVCGNTADASVEITNIDNTPPQASYLFGSENWYEGDPPLEVAVSAFDNQSGLSDNPYSFDAGLSWEHTNTISVFAPGFYGILIRDRLGNTAELSFTASYASKNEDTPDGGPVNPVPSEDENKKDDSPEPSSEDENKNKIEPFRENSESEEMQQEETLKEAKIYPAKDSPQEENPEIRIPEPPKRQEETVTEKIENYLPISGAAGDVPKAPVNTAHIPFYQTKAFKVTSTVTGSLAALLVLAALFLFLFSGVIVYNLDGTKYKFMAILPIRHSSRGYCVLFSEKFCRRRHSSRYKLILGPVFCARKKNKQFFVHTKTRWIGSPVSREIFIEI